VPSLTNTCCDLLHVCALLRWCAVEEREAASKERIEALATDVKTARDKERTANNTKREVERCGCNRSCVGCNPDACSVVIVLLHVVATCLNAV
jgi:hypothetical protein